MVWMWQGADTFDCFYVKAGNEYGRVFSSYSMVTPAAAMTALARRITIPLDAGSNVRPVLHLMGSS